MDTILTIISLTYEDNMKKSFFLFLLLLLTRLLFSENVSIQDVLDELNFVRTNPQGYIKILREHINTFDGMQYVDEIGRTIGSHEGTRVVYECIEVLKNTEPMQALSMNENLCSVALWLAKDSVYSGKLGCVASDGSTSIDRIRKAGFAKSSWSEDSFYGAFTARDFVLAFLINDGLPSRECRDRILDKKFNQVGIGLASGHPAYDSVLIIELVAK